MFILKNFLHDLSKIFMITKTLIMHKKIQIFFISLIWEVKNRLCKLRKKINIPKSNLLGIMNEIRHGGNNRVEVNIRFV
jgi:hypothetical protein